MHSFQVSIIKIWHFKHITNWPLQDFSSILKVLHHFSLIKYLIDGLFKICNNWDTFHNDIENIKSNLIKPPFLINKVIKKYLNHKLSSNKNQLKDTSFVYYFKLPYIGNFLGQVDSTEFADFTESVENHNFLSLLIKQPKNYPWTYSDTFSQILPVKNNILSSSNSMFSFVALYLKMKTQNSQKFSKSLKNLLNQCCIVVAVHRLIRAGEASGHAPPPLPHFFSKQKKKINNNNCNKLKIHNITLWIGQSICYYLNLIWFSPFVYMCKAHAVIIIKFTYSVCIKLDKITFQKT